MFFVYYFSFSSLLYSFISFVRFVVLDIFCLSFCSTSLVSYNIFVLPFLSLFSMSCGICPVIRSRQLAKSLHNPSISINLSTSFLISLLSYWIFGICKLSTIIPLFLYQLFYCKLIVKTPFFIFYLAYYVRLDQ